MDHRSLKNDNYGRDQFIINDPGTVVINPAPQKERDSLQQTLLATVKEEVQRRLAQSLHTVVDA